MSILKFWPTYPFFAKQKNRDLQFVSHIFLVVRCRWKRFQSNSRPEIFAVPYFRSFWLLARKKFSSRCLLFDCLQYIWIRFSNVFNREKDKIGFCDKKRIYWPTDFLKTLLGVLWNKPYSNISKTVGRDRFPANF